MSPPRCEIEEITMAGSATTYRGEPRPRPVGDGRYADAPLPHLIAGRRVPSRSARRSRTTRRSMGGRSARSPPATQPTSTPQRRRPTTRSSTGAAVPAPSARRSCTPADLIVERRHEIAVTECVDTGQTMRFMSAAALRGADNFRFFADRAPSAADGLSPVGRPRQLHDSPSDRPCRRNHTVEYAVHVEHLEDRPGARRRLHGGAQAGRMVALHRTTPVGDRPRGRSAAGGSTSCTEWASPPVHRSPRTR